MKGGLSPHCLPHVSLEANTGREKQRRLFAGTGLVCRFQMNSLSAVLTLKIPTDAVTAPMRGDWTLFCGELCQGPSSLSGKPRSRVVSELRERLTCARRHPWLRRAARAGEPRASG